MSKAIIHSEQGHWILANLGKRVLRPGGKELTEKLVNTLQINSKDDVVEFAPGMGFTADLLLERSPKSYKGIELNEEAADRLQKRINSDSRKVIQASASDTGLEPASIDKVIGEAMLTMQADHRKLEIIQEAYRILKPGGFYGIHELGLTPDNINTEIKKEIQRSLAVSLKVNARPLTQEEWCNLLKEAGFKIKTISLAPMHLLKPKRVIKDEGIFRTLKIGFNLLRQPKAKKHVLDMRRVFNKHENNMMSIAIVAEK
ncbi:MAG TPA: methyltransferase domain-containing protein [Edaphocola sp.]|nr:methyltransferase domain-containing protein [Edaphocola sp.]